MEEKMNQNNIKEENWALITGSSSGIGEALSYEFARHGFNIILHGRNKDELERVKNNIKTQSKIIVLDLTKADALKELLKSVENLNIKVLVNNAGFGVSGDFKNTSLEHELDLIKVNIDIPVTLTKEFIKKSSLKYILNTSSLYSYFPVPKQSIYGASKAFLHSFTLAIANENPELSISSLCPGLTYSKFRTRHGKDEKYYPVGLTSEQVAKVAVKGLFKKKKEIVPGLFNKIMAFTIPKLPANFGLSIIRKMNSSRGY